MFVRRSHAKRVVLLLFMLLFAGTNQAMAGVTSIVLNSDPGDPLAGGQLLIFGESDGTFFAQNVGDGNSVSVSFNTPSYNHWWTLEFAAPDLQPLAVASYDGAVRYPFQGPGQPGLSVYGDGVGCNTLTGRFTIVELVLGGGSDVVSFRATFEQHCEGVVPALRGEVRYNATVPLQLTAPSAMTILENHFATFMVDAAVQGGGHVVLSASNVPLGASFVDNGNNTGTFGWTPLSSQAGTYLITIQATSGTLIEVTYVRITVLLTPPPNDEIEGAIPISGLPFTHTQQTDAATAAPDDPFCYGTKGSVWFAFTPIVAARVEFNTIGSNYDTALSAYSGTRGNLSYVACSSSGSQSQIRFDATAGVTYYIMVGAPFWASPGSLTLNALLAPPPLTMQITLDAFSVVDPSSGDVLVRGTAICSAPAFVSLNGGIRQVRAGHEVRGFFNTSIPCDGTTPWEAPVWYFTSGVFDGRAAALFNAGRVDVTANAFAYDPIEGTYIYRYAMATIRLRGSQ